jgi:D-serine deaminase-like pyridoxal phosphate-dependent protein
VAIDYETWKRILAGSGERLPIGLVDLDAFDRNAAALESLAGGMPIRLATKSVRVPSLIRRVLERGDAWRGLMSYCAAEATLLAREGFDDLLVAYPTLQAPDLADLRALHEAGTTVSLVVDGTAGIDALAAAMAGVAAPFRCVIELDASWRPFGAHVGVRRSPVRSAEDLARVLAHVRSHPQLRCIGVMSYEAHIAGLPDRNPYQRTMSPAYRLVRRLAIKPLARLRAQVADVFADAGVELELFNGGGTGSLTWAASEPHLTELTAGSGLLCSHLFDYYTNFSLEPAGFFATQVVRSSDRGFVTCQGGGWVASGEAGADRLPRPHLPAGLRIVDTEGTGEVQTPLRVPAGSTLAPGDPVIFRHAKAGEPAERLDAYLLVQGGDVVERAPTYRGLHLTTP